MVSHPQSNQKWKGTDKFVPYFSKSEEQNQPSKSPDPPKSRFGTSWGRKIRSRGVSDKVREAHEHPRRTRVLPQKRPRGFKSRPRVPTSQPSDAREPPKKGLDPAKGGAGEPQVEL